MQLSPALAVLLAWTSIAITSTHAFRLVPPPFKNSTNHSDSVGLSPSSATGKDPKGPLRLNATTVLPTSVPAIAHASPQPIEISPFLPQPIPVTDFQFHRNCRGSGMCASTGSHCQKAAALFKKNVLYKDYTSLTHVNKGFGRCAAIYVCNQGYGDGKSGGEINLAFDRLWAINPSTGKRCKKCGSIDLEGPGECHVTANYCWNCQDVNADGEADYSQRVQT